MAPSRRPRFWDRFFQNLPPWDQRETASLMCHTSGKLVGRRSSTNDANAQWRWFNWLAATVAAIGILLLLSKLARGEAPVRRAGPAIVASCV